MNHKVLYNKKELLFLACATLCKFNVLDKLFAQENLNRFAPIVKQKKRRSR